MTDRADADRPTLVAGAGRLRTGVDVQSIDRFRSVEEGIREAVLERAFGPAERAYCEGTRHPAEHYAARWAATEAFLKVLDDPGGVPLSAVAVRREESGRPRLALAAAAREALSVALGTEAWTVDVSLSHDRTADAAVAQVVAQAVPDAPDRGRRTDGSHRSEADG